MPSPWYEAVLLVTALPITLSVPKLLRPPPMLALLLFLTAVLAALTVPGRGKRRWQTGVEFPVRRRFAQEQRTLAGLSAGQPTRATARPTTERLLGAFKEITLTVLHSPQHTLRHLPALTPLQQQILALLDLSPDLSHRLTLDSPPPP